MTDEAFDTGAALAAGAPDPVPGEGAVTGEVSVERALRMVRSAAAVIAVAAAVGARSGGGAWMLLGILLGAAAINGFTIVTERRGWATMGLFGGQLLDVLGSLFLVGILDQALAGSGWMVLLLPIVMGGVRFGAAGTLLAWTLCSIGYLTMAMTEMVEIPGDASAAFTVSLQRFAFLLALAVPVAALTQWMQQRWEQQRVLTGLASQRAQRLAIVEEVARGLAGATEPELMAELAAGVLRLGFTSSSITRHDGERWATVAFRGQARDLPDGDAPPLPEADETVVTHWSGAEGGPRLVSVSVLLDDAAATQVVHGWVDGEVDDDRASSLGLLGAHARVALRGARLLAEVQLQATQDPLTRLLNRRAFNERLDRLAEDSVATSLLVLDLDHFKAVNDGFGHPAGDRVLSAVSDRLRRSVDDPAFVGRATVARLGGDEFAVILAGAPLDEVVAVAERIESAMQDEVALGSASVKVSFSIGIADASGEWAPEALVTAADDAAYEAKAHGRSRSCWSEVSVGSGAHTEADELPGPEGTYLRVHPSVRA